MKLENKYFFSPAIFFDKNKQKQDQKQINERQCDSHSQIRLGKISNLQVTNEVLILENFRENTD